MHNAFVRPLMTSAPSKQTNPPHICSSPPSHAATVQPGEVRAAVGGQLHSCALDWTAYVGEWNVFLGDTTRKFRAIRAYKPEHGDTYSERNVYSEDPRLHSTRTRTDGLVEWEWSRTMNTSMEQHRVNPLVSHDKLLVSLPSGGAFLVSAGLPTPTELADAEGPGRFLAELFLYDGDSRWSCAAVATLANSEPLVAGGVTREFCHSVPNLDAPIDLGAFNLPEPQPNGVPHNGTLQGVAEVIAYSKVSQKLVHWNSDVTLWNPQGALVTTSLPDGTYLRAPKNIIQGGLVEFGRVSESKVQRLILRLDPEHGPVRFVYELFTF